MYSYTKRVLAGTLLVGGLLASATPQANAATADVTTLVAVRVYPPMAMPYNKVSYTFNGSWSDPNRYGVAQLDYCQSNVQTQTLLLSYYYNSPFNVNAVSTDQIRPVATGNYYRLSVAVRDSITFALYASDAKTTPAPP